MPGSARKKVPRFFILRIYTFSAIIYLWLVLPFLLIMLIKNIPEMESSGLIKYQRDSETGYIEKDSLDRIISSGINGTYVSDSLIETMVDSTAGISGTKKNGEQKKEVTINPANEHIDDVFALLLNLYLVGFIAGLIVHIPFKKYFRYKRKNKYIPARLNGFVKKYLLYTPHINAGILALVFIVVHTVMVVNLLKGDTFNYDLEREMYQNLFLISIIASLLSVLFVFFWQKHRVHLKYLEYVFSKEELKHRIFKSKKAGKIRNRMIVSAVMTTLLPLTIVLLYLFLSITHIKDLELNDLTEGQKTILFGKFQLFHKIFYEAGNQDDNSLFYVNAVNSFFMIFGIFSGILVALIYIFFFIKWTTQDLVYPIRELLDKMIETGKGKMYNFGIVRTNNELGLLTEEFNDMSEKLGDYINSISEMTEAYSRFVPKQFLEILGKKRFVDIKLGDQVQKDMTVLFSDIRSFTEISETMTPKENFDFINYYLGYMEPVIRNNNGFIDKYIGDSIMALFSHSPEDALNAAIEMRFKLSQFNQVMEQFNKPVINSGIGIHFGSLMLGVVGGEGRMDGTVISDAVNLASRLEGLTKMYGSSIIISQETLAKMKNPEQYNFRFLDIVKVKGKREPSHIFEVIDGDPEDIKELKLKTKDDFIKAIKFYRAKNPGMAIELFEKILEINPSDKASQVYYERCKSFIESGIPDDWDGIETINLK